MALDPISNLDWATFSLQKWLYVIFADDES